MPASTASPIQSTVYPTGDTSGYTIEVAAYGRDNFSILLQHAFTLFAQHGLGKPQTFRAGGWTADMNTFLALTGNGFISDSSALNWKWIQASLGRESTRELDDGTLGTDQRHESAVRWPEHDRTC